MPQAPPCTPNPYESFCHPRAAEEPAGARGSQGLCAEVLPPTPPALGGSGRPGQPGRGRPGGRRAIASRLGTADAGSGRAEARWGCAALRAPSPRAGKRREVPAPGGGSGARPCPATRTAPVPAGPRPRSAPSRGARGARRRRSGLTWMVCLLYTFTT